jgi:hypothetical protein
LNFQNESGVPFGQASLGKVKFTAQAKNLAISSSSCFLTILGDKTARHYSLTDNVSISKEKTLNINCIATNSTDTALSLTPYFETRYGSLYGGLARQAGGDYTPISVAKGEKKLFSIALPKSSMSKSYVAKFQLTSEKYSSNNIHARYLIEGVDATIFEISPDKDYYRAGDTSQLLMIWSASGPVKLNINITNGDGKDCASTFNQDLVKKLNSPEAKVSIPITRTCLDSKVQATLTDKSGNVLDQKEFSFKTSGEHNEIVKKASMKNAIIALIVLVILAVIFILKRKKKVAGAQM